MKLRKLWSEPSMDSDEHGNIMLYAARDEIHLDEEPFFLLTPAELEAVRREAWEAAIAAGEYEEFEEWLVTLEDR